MLKNLTLYRIGGDLPALSSFTAELEKRAFAECLPTQAQSAGFVPPRGHEFGTLVETLHGHWISKASIERRSVPTHAVTRRTDELAQLIEQTTGRKPGKKQTKELKEQALLELLPRAFSKASHILVWIDTKAKIVAIDTASQSTTDLVIRMLVDAAPEMNLAPIVTTHSPAGAMSAWLAEGEAPAGFSIDRECELKSVDEMKSVVRYARHPLDIDEVRHHIAVGKSPTKAAMTWKDRLSFVLTASGQIRKIDFLDAVFLNQASTASDEDAFDADVAIFTGELSLLINEMCQALGGVALPDRIEPVKDHAAI